MKEHKFPYNWTLKDAVFTKDKGKVFRIVMTANIATEIYDQWLSKL